MKEHISHLTWQNKVDILARYLAGYSFGEISDFLGCYSHQIRQFILSKHFRGILLSAFQLAITKGLKQKEILKTLRKLKRTKIVYKDLRSHDRGHIEWRKKVFKRDDWTCQECKARGGYLQAHHIKAYAKYPELRYDLDNGTTLCLKHHRNINNK